jgi:DNA repair protein RecN (Recombination protein N)
VRKASDGAVTESGVQLLDEPGRVRELARMLGGMEDSGSAQAHAEELLAGSAPDRALAPSAPAGRRSDPGRRSDGGPRTTTGRSGARRGTIDR